MRSTYAFVAFLAFGTLAVHARAEDTPLSPSGDGLGGTEPTSREVLLDEYPPPGTGTTVALAGGAIFLGWYGGALASSFIWSDEPGLKDLRYPVVGPWLSLRDANSCSGGECSTGTVVARVALTIVDGIGQLGGLGALVEGLCMPKEGPAASRVVSTREERVHAAPFLTGRGDMGLSVWGAF